MNCLGLTTTSNAAPPATHAQSGGATGVLVPLYVRSRRLVAAEQALRESEETLRRALEGRATAEARAEQQEAQAAELGRSLEELAASEGALQMELRQTQVGVQTCPCTCYWQGASDRPLVLTAALPVLCSKRSR